jgi:hypothetical protein
VNPKTINAMSKALFDSDLVASRLTLFLAEFLWAIMLIWPGDTFSRPTYLVMSHILTEEAWAAVFLVSAVFQLTIVLQDSFDSKFARYFSAWNACLWLTVVTSMLLSVYPPPAAISGEMALCVLATWIWVRPYILMEGIRRAGYYTDKETRY